MSSDPRKESDGLTEMEEAQSSGSLPTVERIETSRKENNGKLHLTDEEALAWARANPKDDEEIYIVFGGQGDKSNPRHWSHAKKYYVSCLACALNVVTCICIGSISSAGDSLTAAFGSSDELNTGALSTYILGLAVGPLLLAPLSEYFGRNPVYIVSWFGLVIFQIPLALAPNMNVVLGVRFLQGFCGSAVSSCSCM